MFLMDSMDIPLWIKIPGLFLAITLVFVLGAWEIIWNWVCDATEGVRSKTISLEGLARSHCNDVNNNSRKESIMANLFKVLGILFVLCLLALPLAGCDNPPWEGGMVLNLKVDTPRDGTTVTTSTVTVGGRVTGTQKAGARVTINGADVPVKDDKFSTSVTLTEGTNVIDIVAESGGAKPSQKVTVTYAPAKK
jgi:hypothetical protein